MTLKESQNYLNELMKFVDTINARSKEDFFDIIDNIQENKDAYKEALDLANMSVNYLRTGELLCQSLTH